MLSRFEQRGEKKHASSETYRRGASMVRANCRRGDYVRRVEEKVQIVVGRDCDGVG